MTHYELVTNSVAPQQVRETDDAFIIEDVPFIKPMRLSGGYVPRANIEETAPLWDGVPVTLQHARNPQGEPIAASRRPDLQLGVVTDPTFDGEHVRANIRVSKDRLEDVADADTVAERLRSGDPIDVSSQYAPEPLESGEYDGAHRDNVERIVRPDSVALLPNQRGKCSIEDGCGIDPQLVANADVHIPMTQTDNATHGEDMDSNAEATVEYDGTAGGTLDESAIPTDDFEPHYAFPGENKTDSSFPLVDADGDLRSGNVAAAFRFRDDAPDTEALVDLLEDVNDEFDDPPIEPESLEDAMSANSGITAWLTSFLGLGTDDSDATMGAESPADWSPTDDHTQTVNRNELIDDITENSALTEDALEERCDDGLQAIHNDIMSDNNEETSENEATTDADDTELTLNDLSDEAEAELVSRVEEQIEANRTDDRQNELAREIAANSAEYEDAEDVQEDFPTEAALKTKRDQVTDSGMPSPAGLEANFDSDDDLPEVSAGVLGGDD